MLKIRVIPILLLKNTGLEKGIRFEHHVYIGCATNAARVFNNYNVDEIVLLDITATEQGKTPDLATVKEIAEESFMPIAVGGGIRKIEDVRALLNAGADRVVINTSAVENPGLIREGAERFGSQCMVVSIDAKKTASGEYEVFTRAGKKAAGIGPVELARKVESLGAGEIIITSIDREGTMEGYDLELVRQVAGAVSIPVIAAGGAGNERHFAEAIDQGHASAAAAGAMFVFFGRRRTVLITYPTDVDLRKQLGAERVRTKDKPGLWWP